MFRFGLTSLVKFVIGVVLLQGVTALLVVTALRTSLEQTWPLFGALAVAVGVLTALWLHSIADSARKQCLAKAQEGFSREREKIRVRAEQEKTREVRSSQRQIQREKQKASTSSNLKTGVMIGGAVGVGVVMLLTQMVTLGLLTLSTAGGAALGYGVRARQDRLGRAGRGLLGGGGGRALLARREREIKVIEAKPEDQPKSKPRRGVGSGEAVEDG
jgi:predicted outer membrane lipoprotein